MAETKKSPIMLIAIAAVVLIAGAGWFFTQGSNDVAEPAMIASDTSTETAQADGEERVDLYLGDADAPIEFIEYASYTCPHCAAFHQNVYPKLKAEYIDTGKVKFIMREVYFDQFGLAAGLLARCGGDIRYYGIADLLYKKQSEWANGSGEAVVQNLYRIGRQAGLDDAQMQACLQDQELSKALVADFQLKAGRDDVNATPSFVINGEKVSNESWSALKSRLDGMLN